MDPSPDLIDVATRAIGDATAGLSFGVGDIVQRRAPDMPRSSVVAFSYDPEVSFGATDRLVVAQRFGTAA